MLKPDELIRLQLELECTGIDKHGRLYRIECADPDDLPLYYVARHADGYTTFIGRDVEKDIAAQLEALPPEKAFKDLRAVKKIVYGSAFAKAAIWHGKSYTFERMPVPESYPDAVEEPDAFVVYYNEDRVAAAWSERLSERAAEIAVESSPRYRHRGMGRQVALAWVAKQLREGRVPFYSHYIDNKASEALAKGLDAVQFMEVIVYA